MVDRFKKFYELSGGCLHLSNYVQMDEKTTKNAKIMKVTHSAIKMVMKIVFIGVYANNSSTVRSLLLEVIF